MAWRSGYSTRTDNGGKRYDNAMVAHVWNAQSEERGQSNNGNFYFEGRTLFSYGSHFVVGYIMPDGLALLNADGYSVSTSGHKSDARNAVSNRRRAMVASLSDLAGYWKPVDRLARWIDDGKPAGERARVREAIMLALREHATALSSPILAAGEWGYDSWDYDTSPATRVPFDRSGLTQLGAYLADLAGLPAASWPKAKRDAEAKAKRDKAAKDSADRNRAESRALQLADTSPRRWREWMAELASHYNGEARLGDMRREHIRARGLMLKATRGKLAAAGRLAIVRERIKRRSAMIATHKEQSERRKRARRLSVALATVRDWRDASSEGKAAVTWHRMRSLAEAAQTLQANGRLQALRNSCVVLAAQAADGARAIEAENVRKAALERENREKAMAERIKLWLEGAPVGAIRFDAVSGGAAMRIVGDTLETSHGASVPLAHAVKAFRFIKLCRERGEAFKANGRTIRVGHFQVDSISAEGDMVAGCHSFAWPEIERVARAAGVFECAPSADAVEEKSHA